MPDPNRISALDDRSMRLVVAAAVFELGALLFAVGVFATVSRVLADASGVSDVFLEAVVTTGVIVPAVVLTAVLVLADSVRSGRIATGVALVSLALVSLWVLVPAGWSGTLGLESVVPAVVYSLGLLVLVNEFFAAILEYADTNRASAPTVEYRRTSSERDTRSPVLNDGGNDTNGIESLLDDEE